MSKHTDLRQIVDDFIISEWPAAEAIYKGYSNHHVCATSIRRAIKTMGYGNDIAVVTKPGSVYLVNRAKCEKIEEVRS